MRAHLLLFTNFSFNSKIRLSQNQDEHTNNDANGHDSTQKQSANRSVYMHVRVHSRSWGDFGTKTHFTKCEHMNCFFSLLVLLLCVGKDRLLRTTVYVQHETSLGRPISSIDPFVFFFNFKEHSTKL